MKKHGYVRLLVGVLLIGLAAVSADAQSMKVNIPFDFSVGNTALPAGTYSVQQAIPHANANVLVLRRTDGSAQALSMGTRLETITAVKGPQLVFHKYGNRYFLSQVWLKGGNAGAEIREGTLERELAKGGSSAIVATVIADAR